MMASLSRNRSWVASLGGAALVMIALTRSLGAQEPPPPPEVHQLLHLLEDPAVRGWIDWHRQPGAANEPPQRTASAMMANRTAGMRQHIASLAAAAPGLPGEFRSAVDRVLGELQGRSPFEPLILLVGFLALGAGSEWIFQKATRGARARLIALPVASAYERVRVIALQAAFGFAEVAIFALGSIGAFLAFDWPPLLKQVVLAYLVAAVILRLTLVAGRFLLAPKSDDLQAAERFRMVPVTTDVARFWHRRLALFIGSFAFGWSTIDLLGSLGFSSAGRELVSYALGLGLLAIALNVAWSRLRPGSREMADASEHRSGHRALGAWLLSLYFILLWGLWAVGQMGLFWLALAALLLPTAIAISERASRHVLRPPDGSDAPALPNLLAVYLDRSVRAVLIIGTALLLARAWQIDLVAMTSRDMLLTRLIRGALSSIVILLVADLIWQVIKTLIDRRLGQPQIPIAAGTEEAVRQARLRTLLPIFRNVAFVVLAAVSVMMVLSALGVEIGPLIAGAGIAGIAVGFGAQTLVKDVISGIFYLLDDAFRVGEYIQSGSYKGTVESFGFRSVKLRHHRGPIYTVPFGILGAVENMSRDWVIDKMSVGVTYDADLDKAKTIIKQIGKDLAKDPEFASHIIEPLKMQGVEQFGDYAIQLRLKMTTRPGEQFVIRRRALALIKKAFDENGIRFAFPTVHVAGRQEAEPAAAHQALKLVKPAPPE